MQETLIKFGQHFKVFQSSLDHNSGWSGDILIVGHSWGHRGLWGISTRQRPSFLGLNHFSTGQWHNHPLCIDSIVLYLYPPSVLTGTDLLPRYGFNIFMWHNCIFLPTKSEVWAYCGCYKNIQGQLFEDGSPICRSCEKKVGARGGNTSNLLTFTLRPSPSTVQRMQGKLTSSLCAWCMSSFLCLICCCH